MGFFTRIQRTKDVGSDLSTPGETPVVVPVQPVQTPLPTRAPANFAGVNSGRGTLTGGSFARGVANVTWVGTELIDARGTPNDLRVVNPDMFISGSRPSPAVTGRYRPGKSKSVYRIAANRDYGIQPFYSNNHGKIRRSFARVSTQYDGSSGGPAGKQTNHGTANPVVSRDRPMPWDQGIIRGGS